MMSFLLNVVPSSGGIHCYYTTVEGRMEGEGGNTLPRDKGDVCLSPESRGSVFHPDPDIFHDTEGDDMNHDISGGNFYVRLP